MAKKSIEQDILAGANIVRGTATIRYEDKNGPEWWVCHMDGQIELFGTAARALRAVQKHATKIIEMTRTSAAVVTTVQWLNTREGFVPPKKGTK